MACKFILNKTQEESKLYLRLLDETGGNVETATKIANLTVRQDFLDQYGNWMVDPNLYSLKSKDEIGNLESVPRLYEYGRDDEGNIIYGEPLYNDVMQFLEEQTLLGKDFNIGKFEAAANKKIKALQSAIAAIEKAMNVASRQRNSRRRQGKLKKSKKELEEDFERLTDEETNKRMSQFALNVLSSLKDALNKFENLRTTLDLNDAESIAKNVYVIQDIYNFIQAFSAIDDIVIDYREGRLEVSEETAAILEEVGKLRQIFEGQYREFAKDIVIDKFSTGESVLEEMAVSMIKKEYEQLRNKYKSEKERAKFGIDKSFEEYLEERLTEQGNLKNRGDRLFASMLESATTDISTLQRWLYAVMDAPDDVLRAMQKEIAITEDKIRLEWHGKVKNLHDLRMKLNAAVEAVFGKPKTTADLYKFMDEYDADGKKTGYYVSEYYSAWTEYVNSTRRKIYASKKLTQKEKDEKWARWRAENITENFVGAEDLRLAYENGKRILASTEDDTAFLEALEALKLRHQKNFTVFYKPKKQEDIDKYKNPQFEKLQEYRKGTSDEKVLWQYYSTYMKQHLENDIALPERFRLGFRQPTMRKDLMERFEELEFILGVVPKLFGNKGFYQVIVKPYLQEETQYVSGEISERGEEDFDKRRKEGRTTLTQDKEGRSRQYIPINYRGKIDPKDRANDLHTMLLRNTYNSLNHQKMTELLPYLEMMLYFLENRVTFTTRNGLQVFGPGQTGRNFTEGNSNVYEMARDEIENRVFGIRELDPGVEIFGLNAMKVSKLIRSYVSLTMLSFNFDSSAANSNLAGTVTAIEALAGEFFGPKQWASAQAEMLRNGTAMAKDLLEPIDIHSKVNVLSYVFDPLNNFDHREFNYGLNVKNRQLANGFSFHMLNSRVEKYHQSTTMIAYMKNIKLVDEDGKYIDAKDKTKRTDDRDKALSLYDGILVRDGKIIAQPDLIAQVEIQSGDRLIRYDYKNPDDIRNVNIRITHTIQAINSMLHGNYSHRNAIPLQRLWWGAHIIQHKKYLSPGFYKRYGGIIQTVKDYTPLFGNYWRGKPIGAEYLGADGKPVANPLRMYDPMFDQFRSLGSWSEAYKFIGKVMADVRLTKWHLLSENWNELDANQKANIKRTVAELGFAVVLGIAAPMIAAAAEDDPDDEALYYRLSFYAFRLQSELLQYISFTEATRILRNPAATVTMLERIMSFLGQLSSDGVGSLITGEGPEIYKTGLRKGEWKLGKKFYDMVPFYKHFNRTEYLEDILSFYTETNQTR